MVVRETDGLVSWEIASRPPAAALRPYVRDFCGYAERGLPGLVRRTEFPGPQVVVIFDFGPQITVCDNRDGHRPNVYDGGFVAGLDDRYTMTEHQGTQRGLQLNLTPLGARLFFGLPMSDLTGRVVHLSDLLPREHRTLTDRLQSLRDWDARFDLLEAIVTHRLGTARDLNPVVTWAYEQIQRHQGNLELRQLTKSSGYSPTHLIALFRDHVGLPPKLVARLTRFERLVRHLKTGRATNLASLAAECGYYDQAHLVRDMHQFAGMTPSQARTRAQEVPAGAILESLRANQSPHSPAPLSP
jgi:AraC-like DNA-binding protein